MASPTPSAASASVALLVVVLGRGKTESLGVFPPGFTPVVDPILPLLSRVGNLIEKTSGVVLGFCLVFGFYLFLIFGNGSLFQLVLLEVEGLFQLRFK